jgi:hypothetical protein
MVLSFSWVFCTSLPNQVEHTWLKSQLYVWNYEWAWIIFVDGVLTQNFNIVDLVKFLERNKKTSHLDRNSHIEGDIMQNHVQKKKWKKVKNQDFMGKTNFFLSTLPFSLWAVLATWWVQSRSGIAILDSLIPDKWYLTGQVLTRF